MVQSKLHVKRLYGYQFGVWFISILVFQDAVARYLEFVKRHHLLQAFNGISFTELHVAVALTFKLSCIIILLLVLKVYVHFFNHFIHGNTRVASSAVVTLC